MKRALLLAAALAACTDRYPRDAELRLNHLQAKGTHNSYHQEPPDPPDPSVRFTHAPLDVQLELQGVRQLELDLHKRKDGGLEVFHLPGDIDSKTTCRRFPECLALIRDWSDAHPDHLPLMIWIEPKDQELDWADADFELLEGKLGLIDADIKQVLGRRRVFVPDDLRGRHPNPRDAVREEGWPTLGEVRGKVLFALLDEGRHRREYTAGHEDLSGKMMFVDTSTPSEPWAATFKINDPQRDRLEIERRVREGFLVTTTSDEVNRSDDANRRRFEAALASGAHYLSSDLPAPSMRAYFAEIPGGTPARCNPVTAPEGCSSRDLETTP